MTRLFLLLALLLLSACASSRFEANVTRFHQSPPPPGQSVAVVSSAPGLAESLEFRAQAAAVERQLAAAGFRLAPEAEADLLAVLAVGTTMTAPGRRSSPVTVGIGGGSGGSWGGVGGSVAFPVGGNRSSEVLTTDMRLSLKRRTDREILWEGRATATVEGSPPVVNPDLLARALLEGFPGPSGKTVRWVAK
ncbi:DUF4136 domain-containing protein [Thermaurantiacus sp.]